MKKEVLILTLIGLSLLTIALYVYYNFEKPEKEKADSLTNLSIATLYKGKKIDGLLGIESGSFFYKNLTTSSKGYVFVQVPSNETIIIKNLDNDFYKDEIKLNTTGRDLQRVDFNLIRPAKIAISYNVSADNKQITLDLIPDGEFRDAILCMRWGVHTVSQEVENLSVILNKKFDRCYNLETINTERKMNIKHSIWGILDRNDFLNVVIMDEDSNKYNQTINYNINNI